MGKQDGPGRPGAVKVAVLSARAPMSVALVSFPGVVGPEHAVRKGGERMPTEKKEQLVAQGRSRLFCVDENRI